MTAPRLHVDVHEGVGPYALVVHGLLSSRGQWVENLAALSTVCRPVVVELLGHGRSPAPPGAATYAPGAYVEAFDALRRALGADRWVVIGQSLGAALTLRYALDRPDRVLAQVLTNSASALGDDAWRARIAPDLTAIAQRIDEHGRPAIAKLSVHPSRARRLPPAVRAELLADAELLDPHGVASAFRHTVPASSCYHRVGENRVPSLLVVGTREKAFAPSRRYAEEAMPHLRVVAADAGHAVNAQAAAVFDEAVRRFFGDVLPASG